MAYTPKARALGAVLHRIRQEKGLTLRDITEGIHIDPGSMSRWENGERVPKPEVVAQILTWYGIAGVRFHEIMTLAYRTGEPQWLAGSLPEQRLQMEAYVDLEQKATHIVESSALLVPGLLQTEDYFRAMIAADDVPADEVDSRVASRLARREAIEKRNPAQFVALIGQAAFRQGVGGRKVMLEQINHLLRATALPNVGLRMVPDGRGWHPGLDGLFTIIQTEPGRHGSIVFVGNRRAALMLHEDEDVSAYRQSIDRIARVALTAEASTNYIVGLAKRWESDR